MNFLDKLGNFYFGIGGVGDFLLLMSVCYDNESEFSILFWANDSKFIQNIANLFPKIKHKVIFQGWQPNPLDQYKKIIAHPNFKGKAHIPEELAYVEQWINNPNKYLSEIKKPFAYLKSFN